MKDLPDTIEGVLFDLDGTLLDSAPDLYTALVDQCAEEGVSPPPYFSVRAVVSQGARAVLRCGFGARGEPALDALTSRYLEIYQRVMGQQTAPFDGIESLIECLESQGICWGIVTNKSTSLTEQQLVRIGWDGRAGAVVCGDTLPVKKPDPAPVRLACSTAGIMPPCSVFVGDDPRDIQAGAAAGLYTVAVTWGYLDGGDPHAWGADAVIDHPSDLARLLRLFPVGA